MSLEESFLAYSDDVEAVVEDKLMYQKLLKTASWLPSDQREVIVLKFIGIWIITKLPIYWERVKVPLGSCRCER